MSDLLKKLYRVFDPSPLRAGQDALYVDLDSVRGDSSIVEPIKAKILLADGPTCQVLTGHRGSGKSTELWRLRQALETSGSERFFVVQVQADEELDRNDVDFPDLLIAIVRQIAKELRERADIKLEPGYFKDRWQRLKELALSTVEFNEIQLEAGMAKLSSTLRGSPEVRKQVRAALEPDTDNWLKAANDVIGAATLALGKRQFRGLVVMVDDLDKMITRPHETPGASTTEHLFIHRAPQLTGFACHMLYTVPIELAYSHQGPSLTRLYGGNLPVVPMTKIETPPPASKPYAKGMARFREIIEARLNSVGATEQDLFENERIRNELIKLTGGQPTELMSLIREAIVTAGLPIGSDGIKRCRAALRRGYVRYLRQHHWPILQEVRATGNVAESAQDAVALRELLESRAILVYRNSHEWYGVNPALDDLEPPPPLAEPCA